LSTASRDNLIDVNILFLSQRVPYPPNRGDKITSWRLVERMSRTHDVRCIAFAHGKADMEAAEELERRGISTTPIPYHDRWKKIASLPLLLTRKPLTLGVYGSRKLQAEVDALADWADLYYAYSSSMSAFVEKYDSKPRVMHLGELDSDKWRQYSERTRFPMSWLYRREWHTLFEFERRIALAVDENVLCTPLEEKIFREQIPGASSTVLRNGVDLEAFRPAREKAEEGHLVFTGVMNYYPNVDGCIWFANEILPRIRERIPGARFTIVGAHPTPEIEALSALDGVTITGFVDSVTDWLDRAAIAIAPLRIARGIQNKVLEAMASGLPVVGTTSATQGVGGQAGRDFLLADDVTAFADHVCSLLEDTERAAELGRAARTFVEENYDWEVVFQHLDVVIGRTVPEQKCPIND
jgi:polysaccharide biosynthesis protein PslH